MIIISLFNDIEIKIEENTYPNLEGGFFSKPGWKTKQLEAGQDHSCSVHQDGSINCWGANSFGQADMLPEVLNSVKVLGAGHFHTCVAQGHFSASHVPGEIIRCWGKNNSEQCDVPLAINLSARKTQVLAGGADFTCILKGDITGCWGGNKYGQTDIPPDFRADIMRISAGGQHVCTIRNRRWITALTCWGFNKQLQTDPPFTENTFNVFLGVQHSCMILGFSFNVVCWGDDRGGQVLPRSEVHVLNRQIETLGLGLHHTCVKTLQARIDCWGTDDQGQTCVPKWGRDSSLELPAGTGVKAIASGANHNCIIANFLTKIGDGRVYCWGDTRQGQTRVLRPKIH